ncbi:hypothetical protein OV450_2247 [Actinobacteria bacterium OV450]|nr:hypothetical protein OV450_2247 [Actinobacteria bacterium OV450]
MVGGHMLGPDNDHRHETAPGGTGIPVEGLTK